MKPLPQHLSGPAKGKTVSVTFQRGPSTGSGRSVTVVIRQGKPVHLWHGEAHRRRLLMFCLERGFGKVERGEGLTIYRNW